MLLNIMILSSIFTNKAKIKVLREIFMAEREISNSQIARDTGLSKMSVSRIISNLNKDGIIKSRAVGRSIISEVNKDNYLSQFLGDIFDWEKELEEGLIKVIEKTVFDEFKNNGILSIVLFGSRARKENRLESDFDIMLIIKRGKKENKIRYYQGFKVGVFILSEEEFIQKLNENDPLISNIVIEGKILRGRKEYERIVQKSKF